MNTIGAKIKMSKINKVLNISITYVEKNNRIICLTKLKLKLYVISSLSMLIERMQNLLLKYTSSVYSWHHGINSSTTLKKKKTKAPSIKNIEQHLFCLLERELLGTLNGSNLYFL